MSGSGVPALTTYSPGVGVFNADWGNTVVEGGALLANLRAFPGLSNMCIWMIGGAAPDDGIQGMFYWSPTATAPDDGGVTTIAVNGVTTGRWLRNDASLSGYLPLTGGTLTGELIIDAAGVGLSVENTTESGNIETTGNAEIATSPTGNPTGGALLATYSALDVQATTDQPGNREFVVNIGITSTLGAGVTNNNGDKVALYVGAVGESGTGDLWAFNPLLAQNAGSGTYNAQVLEVDMNNFNADRAGTDGGGGLPTHVANGISISGVNDSNHYANTSGVAVDSFGTDNSPMFSRGHTFNGYFTFATIADYSITPRAYEMWGSYTYGLDASLGGFTGGVILAPNNVNAIVALTSSDTPAVLLNLTGANNVELAITNCAGTFIGTSFSPLTTNTFSCGQSGNLWTSVWATNGTIQTSDPTLKTDIAPLPTAMGIVTDINPVTFRWKVGGQTKVVTGTGKDQTTTFVDVPGKRTHWGFLAPDVKAAFDKVGMDFGGYVKSEDGIERLRPDQLIPVLWKAVQELGAEIAALKAAKA